MTQIVSISLPDDVAAWLTRHAQELGLSKSALVREAFTALQQREDTPPRGHAFDVLVRAALPQREPGGTDRT